MKDRIVVGVDGTESALRGVRFAAAAAKEADAELLVVHAAPARLPVMPVRPVVMGDFDDFAKQIVADAAALARTWEPGLATRTRVTHGPVVRSLVAAAAEASLLVLGSRHERSMAHLWTGRILSEVTARSACTTVVVPPEWEPGRSHGRVLVGFKTPRASATLLATAFAEAARREAELVIVHAWRLLSVYDDIIGSRVAQDAVRAEAEATLEPLLAPLRASHPKVRVTTLVEHLDAVEALVTASREADLLMLEAAGSHTSYPHLGSTARALLRWSMCPVMVIPVPRHASGAPREAADDATDEAVPRERPAASVHVV